MKRISVLIIAAIVLICGTAESTLAGDTLAKVLESTASYISNTATEPSVGSVGGEWAVIGLARSGIFTDDEYFGAYCKRVENFTAEREGILHKKKYTEYSRVILALTALGKDPGAVSGYNLLMPLGDFEKTTFQGINGAIWALIALDSKSYEIPLNTSAAIQATRQMYVDYILEYQNPDGGWALSGKPGASEADITAMALVALSRYRQQDDVKQAIDAALSMLSRSQSADGGFTSGGVATCESSAQVLTALCALELDYTSQEFTKDGKNVLDNILSYYNGDGFMHIKGTETNLMATEQAFYALVALSRYQKGLPGLYTMTDELKLSGGIDGEKSPEISMTKTFADIIGHKNQYAIEALGSLGIINGKSKESFDPDSTMTRAEFATIIVRALGLSPVWERSFDDVAEEDWFYPYAAAASKSSIVKGVSQKLFNPSGTITRQEAAVMICRAAGVLGINTDMDLVAARDMLAEFGDYVKTADWAVKELAFCCNTGIIKEESMEISPQRALKRAEIAQMIYNLLYEV